MQSVLTENTDLLETKLVDILDEFQLPDDKILSIVKEEEENSLILVTATTNESKQQQPVTRRKRKLDEFLGSGSDYSDSDSSQLSNHKTGQSLLMILEVIHHTSAVRKCFLLHLHFISWYFPGKSYQTRNLS